MILQPLAPTGRVGRYPKHTFHIRPRPFNLAPFMIAPVRPGETLQNIYFEARAVTDPITSPIIGWKQEYHFFYVKITDLLIDAIRDMFVDPTNTDLTATYGLAANDQAYYTAKGGVDFLKRGVTRICDTYFRDEGEVAGDQIDATSGYYIVQHKERTFLDSLTDKDDMPEGAAIAGATDMGDLERLINAFETLRAMGMANMSYEDWLRSQGIAIPVKDESKPEHLAFFSDFSYPANVINPADGTAKSAVSWVFKNSMRDPKFFKEPGFIIGLAVTRPKVYLSGLAGNASAHLTRMWDWMTNIAQAVGPETRLKQFAAGTGPLGDRTTDTDAYWLDMADLFTNGDQFYPVAAFDPAMPAPIAGTTTTQMLRVPRQDLKWKYPSTAEIAALFAGANSQVKQDGFASLSVKGDLSDISVGKIAQV